MNGADRESRAQHRSVEIVRAAARVISTTRIPAQRMTLPCGPKARSQNNPGRNRVWRCAATLEATTVVIECSPSAPLRLRLRVASASTSQGLVHKLASAMGRARTSEEALAWVRQDPPGEQ